VRAGIIANMKMMLSLSCLPACHVQR